MKKSKNTPTFAQRAKKIMRKYPKASFDKIEKDALEMEMDALIAEQEAYKQSMGMTQPMGQQEQMPMFGYGDFMDEYSDPFREIMLANQPIPTNVSTQGNEIWHKQNLGNKVLLPSSDPVPTSSIRGTSANMLPMQNMQGIIPGGIVDEKTGRKYDFSDYKTGATIGRGNFMYEGKPSTATVVRNPNPIDPIKSFEANKINAIGRDAVSRANTLQSELNTKESNPFLPSYVSAGATIGGNLIQALMDKRPKPLNLGRYSPREVDLTEQRLAAQREADVARSVGRTSARNLGMNAGATMSGIISSEGDVNRTLSDALMKSRLSEEGANVEAANRAGMFNTELGSKETMLNRQMSDEWRERQRGYVAGAIQAVPDAMKDINQIKAQMEYLKQMGMSQENALKWAMMANPNYSAELQNGVAKQVKFNKK